MGGGHCTFGFVYVHCVDVGPVTRILFFLFMGCVLACLVFAALIDNRLFKNHPEECDEVRLGFLVAYQGYAWRRRGRALGDGRLTTLLDRYRNIQAATYGLVAIIALAAYMGL